MPGIRPSRTVAQVPVGGTRLRHRCSALYGSGARHPLANAGAYAQAEPDPLTEAAAGILEHMNADHAEAQVLFCRHLADRPDTTEAVMSSVDRYGFETTAVSPAGRAVVRLGFTGECTTGEQVRQAKVAMVADARAAASASS